VSVTVFHTRKRMLDHLKKAGARGVSDAGAVCIKRFLVDDRRQVADLVFCHDHLYSGTVAHECYHASCHRLWLCGLRETDDSYEELAATWTGELTDLVLQALFARKILPKLNLTDPAVPG